MTGQYDLSMSDKEWEEKRNMEDNERYISNEDMKNFGKAHGIYSDSADVLPGEIEPTFLY